MRTGVAVFAATHALTRMGWMCEFGGSPSAISIIVMPKLQMSALPSYDVS